MFDLRNRENLGPNAVIVASILVLAATLAVMLFLPKPTTQGMDSERRNREFAIKLDTQKAEQRLEEVRAAIGERAWLVPVSEVGPTALDTVTKTAERRGLRLVAMRPQRTVQIAELAQVPFVVTVEGAFPAVMAFVRDLEAPKTKMAISLIQLGAMDGASDNVSLTLGLKAYVRPPKAQPRPSAPAPAGGEGSDG
ncbi:MAG: type 4a pilus biogenesis protein PilO [Fimbriimonadaceae bacterium]